jgi:hypothetical protein
MTELKLVDDTISKILKSNTIDAVGASLWKTVEEAGEIAKKGRGLLRGVRPIRIAILNAPCNGFGDLIFAMKLSRYLKKWYGAVVTIVTTYADGLIKLSGTSDNIVELVGGRSNQCRRFKHLRMSKKLREQDIIMVAPIQADFEHSLRDVRYLIPYATVFNTFTFSEYNDRLDKKFTFNTGVGSNRDGILLTDPKVRHTKLKGLKNPYSVVYVAGSVDGASKCITSFVSMVAKKKHKKIEELDIVVPSWVHKTKLNLKTVSKFYPRIDMVLPGGSRVTIIGKVEDTPLLTFRTDVFPVPNKDVATLIAHSLKDVLLTGDQSITDAFSCCENKNIFYQKAPWKANLAKNLAKSMPNRYLKKISTSCGGLEAVNYKSTYSQFVKEWDFRKRARPRMDAIILSVIYIRKYPSLKDVVEIASSTQRLDYIKSRVRKYNRR